MFPLQNLIPSLARRRLLEAFLLGKEPQMNIRQAARAAGIHPSICLAELKNLQEAGILTSASAGNQLIYSLNQISEILPELRLIFKKSSSYPGRIKSAIATLPNVSFAFIFGSFADESNNAKSDIDLMVIGKPNLDNLYSEINKLEKELNVEIDNFTITEEEYAERAGSGFIKNVNNSKKIFLKGDEDGLKRIAEKRQNKKNRKRL